MKSIIIFTLVLALASGATVATVDMNAIFDDNSMVGQISGTINDSEFVRGINYQVDNISNTIDFNEIFDYEKLIQVVAVTLNDQGIIPNIKGDIWSLKKSTNFIANLPVK